MNREPILAFSHLRWNSVFQRPHNIMSRLSERRDVLFVEEPIPHRGATTLEVSRVSPRLSVVRVLPPSTVERPDAIGAESFEEALRKLMKKLGWGEFTAWLYTPAAVEVARSLRPRAIVYDCMSELSALRFSPTELLERERDLLHCADLVFTGGPSLYRSKREQHHSVHCFPSSVDRGHFASANGIPEAPEQEEIPRPRLGYFGMIDERMDLTALRVLAVERPKWQIVLVGPVVKINEAHLPRAANIHYMGPRPHQDLPSFVSGWDACLIPFTMNAATRYISPTKCLEYMAADRPIVSTPIADVAELYGDIVHVGKGPMGFLEACDRALHQPSAARSIRSALASQVLRQTSWEETVGRMEVMLGRLGTPSRVGAA